MSSSFGPFILRIFWGGNISYEKGVVLSDEATKVSTYPIYEKFSYEQLVDMVYGLFGVSKQQFNVTILMPYEFQGVGNVSFIQDDGNLQMLFYLALTQPNYMGDVYVKMEPVIPAGYINQEPEETGGFDGYDGYISESTSEDDREDIRFEEDDNDEDGYDEPPAEFRVGIHEQLSQAPMNPYIDISVLQELEDHDFQEDDYMVFWNEETNDIRVGVYFKSKKDVQFVVRQWNVKHGKEIHVLDSRPQRWNATCKTNAHDYVDVVPNTPPCNWMVSATKQGKSSSGLWRIVKWVGGHNCYGSAIRNNNTSLTSKTLASYINHAIVANITYPVKQIQAYCKETLSVDVSYIKAWRARRKAIDNIYGNWESHFQELPKYINTLKWANPSTDVEWRHQTDGSSNTFVFKYVFWAFGPSIEAFHLCRPIISIDGTHLKGSYKGKMLIAVSKDSNGYILPVAYAIVDEETNESWSWFLEQFGRHVRRDAHKKLCIISDRHKGIINAMNNLEGWMEPDAYHRYCLRHIRSNFMAKFKSVELKRLLLGNWLHITGKKVSAFSETNWSSK